MKLRMAKMGGDRCKALPGGQRGARWLADKDLYNKENAKGKENRKLTPMSSKEVVWAYIEAWKLGYGVGINTLHD